MAKKMEINSASYVEVLAVAGAALSGGDVIVGTNLIGFCLVDVANTEEYSLIRKSENVKAEKATGALTIDQPIYWDDTAKNVTGTATSNTLVGWCREAALSADTHVNIIFDGTINYLKA